MSHLPSGVWPAKGTWGLLLYLHNPLLAPIHRKGESRTKDKWIAKNKVDFFHAIPNIQYSTNWLVTPLRLSRATTGGQIQRRDLAGFSNVKGSTIASASSKTRTVNLIKQLPCLTLASSQGLRFANPKGWVSDQPWRTTRPIPSS